MYDHVRRRRWHPIQLLLLLPLIGTLVPECKALPEVMGIGGDWPL